MRRIFFIFLFGLYFGAFAYSGSVPQHAFAAPHIIHRQVTATALEKKDYDRFDHQAYSKTIDYQPAKIYAQSERLPQQRFQNSLGIPWPAINLPDFSFLWKQERGNQKKDIYDRGQ